MKEFLKETHMLDFNDSRIQSLIENRGWKDLEQFECIKAIYLYVSRYKSTKTGVDSSALKPYIYTLGMRFYSATILMTAYLHPKF